ncbi:uncharacterized protein Polr1E [Chironomus tepperi]|uniref:uncharacterized protein Polr1E n=1 Tax=Chironomus tepperi TaxID=113505 RepID=UPI00391F9AA4
MEILKKSKITRVDRKTSDKPAPIIATFQNANINKEIACQSVCKRVATTTDGSKYALIATESNVYKSDLSNAGSEFQDTYIAIHNKKTKEINLIQVENASFKHVLYDDTRSSFEHNILDTAKILAKEFAGKKGAIAFERSQRTKVNSSILEDSVDKMMTSVDTDKFFENDIFEQSQEDQNKFRDYIFPRIDLNESTEGKSVREIFTVSNLIGDEMIEHLSEIAIDILNIDSKNLPFTNKFIKNAVILIQNSKTPESDDNLRKMAMLIYAESLISLINNKSRIVHSSGLMKFSNQLAQDISKKFFIAGSKQASNFTRQKSIVFYVLLTLLCSDSLEVSLTDILDSVDLSKKELVKYAYIMGCKTKGDLLLLKNISKLDKDATFQVPLMKGKKEKKGK